MRRTVLVPLIAASLLALTSAGCGGPAQIGEDKDAFKAVDALYTAISLRDPRQLDLCEKILKDHRSSGKLPEGAGKSLDAIVLRARDGRWEDAQGRLGQFMRGQKR